MMIKGIGQRHRSDLDEPVSAEKEIRTRLKTLVYPPATE